MRPTMVEVGDEEKREVTQSGKELGAVQENQESRGRTVAQLKGSGGERTPGGAQVGPLLAGVPGYAQGGLNAGVVNDINAVVPKGAKHEKWTWCQDNQVKLCEALDIICDRWHWCRYDNGGTPVVWAFQLHGWMSDNGEVKNIYEP